jgi:hypothetical protein
MAPNLRPFIQQEHAVVRPRHVARQQRLAAPDQPHIGDGVMRGAKCARGDDGGTRAGEASDTVDARGLEGFCHSQRQ